MMVLNRPIPSTSTNSWTLQMKSSYRTTQEPPSNPRKKLAHIYPQLSPLQMAILIGETKVSLTTLKMKLHAVHAGPSLSLDLQNLPLPSLVKDSTISLNKNSLIAPTHMVTLVVLVVGWKTPSTTFLITVSVIVLIIPMSQDIRSVRFRKQPTT